MTQSDTIDDEATLYVKKLNFNTYVMNMYIKLPYFEIFPIYPSLVLFCINNKLSLQSPLQQSYSFGADLIALCSHNGICTYLHKPSEGENH